MGVIIGIIVCLGLFSLFMAYGEAWSESRKRDKEYRAEKKANRTPEEIEQDNKDNRQVLYMCLILGAMALLAFLLNS
tara:strand:- start:590 stop:820 length:231 start_codon:yes stop_codon:yes gene_type:complete